MNELAHTYAFITMLRSLQWQHYNFEWPKDPLWSECVFGCFSKRVSLFHHPAGWLFQPWCWGYNHFQARPTTLFSHQCDCECWVDLVVQDDVVWSIVGIAATRGPKSRELNAGSSRKVPPRFHKQVVCNYVCFIQFMSKNHLFTHWFSPYTGFELNPSIPSMTINWTYGT